MHWIMVEDLISETRRGMLEPTGLFSTMFISQYTRRSVWSIVAGFTGMTAAVQILGRNVNMVIDAIGRKDQKH